MDEEHVDMDIEKTVPPKDSIAENYSFPHHLDDKITLRDIYSHMMGPVVSLVFHLLLIAAVGSIVMSRTEPEKTDMMIEMKEVEITEIPPPPQELEVVEMEDYVEFDSATVDRPTLTSENVNLDVQNVSVADNTVADVKMPDTITVKMTNSALKMSGLYVARSGAGRLAALKQYGGSAATERAVMKALHWLVKVQNEDGSWGDMDDVYNQQVQLTSLALLAFLAHGESTDSEEFGDAMMRGLQRVLKWADNPGYKGIIKGDWYAHARVCIVLAEGYAITRIPALERAMNKAVAVMIKHQNPIGGFHTHQDPRTGEMIYRSDLNLGSRMYNALYSSFAAGCEAEGILNSIEKSISAIETCHPTKDGGFSYGMSMGKGGKGDFDATAAGTLYLYLMGSTDTVAGKNGLRWLETFSPGGKKDGQLKMDWKNLPSETSSLGWYYMTQALFQGYKGESDSWKKWNRSMVNTLLKEQTIEGYWPCPADKYSHDEEKIIDGKKVRQQKVYYESSAGGFSDLNGKLWATVYFTLSLEVYYRYLPTFKPQHMGQLTDAPKDAWDGTSLEL